MSTQPFPPSSGGTAPLPVGGRGRRNPLLLVLGAIIVVAGIVAGLLLIVQASSSVEDNTEIRSRCLVHHQFAAMA